MCESRPETEPFMSLIRGTRHRSPLVTPFCTRRISSPWVPQANDRPPGAGRHRARMPTDVDRCAELDAHLFDGDDPWSAAVFERELALKDNYFVGARTAGTLIGYAGIARLGFTNLTRVFFDRGAKHRRGPGLPGTRYRPPTVRLAAEVRRRRRRVPEGPHRQRGGHRAVPQHGI